MGQWMFLENQGGHENLIAQNYKENVLVEPNLIDHYLDFNQGDPNLEEQVNPDQLRQPCRIAFNCRQIGLYGVEMAYSLTKESMA